MYNNIQIDEKVSPVEAFPDDDILRVVWAYGAICWDAKNLATECIHTWPADAL
jgi:hypothetical protein